MSGEELIRTLCHATGLPHQVIQNEVKSLLEKSKKNPEDLSLDDLRDILVHYLQDVLPAAKQSLPG